MRRTVAVKLGGGWQAEAVVETEEGYAIRELRVFGGDGNLPWRRLALLRQSDILDQVVPPTDAFLPPAPAGLSAEERLAHLARDYVALLKRGYRSPNAVLAERDGRSASQVTQDIYRARKRGLLAPENPGHGVSDGHLTDRAREVLSRT